MAAVDVVYEKVHHRHDPRWCARASLRVCVACVIELMDSHDVSVITLLILFVNYYCWNLDDVFKLLIILYRYNLILARILDNTNWLTFSHVV